MSEDRETEQLKLPLLDPVDQVSDLPHEAEEGTRCFVRHTEEWYVFMEFGGWYKMGRGKPPKPDS